MSLAREGIPASPGIVIGPAYVLNWEPPRAPHATASAEAVASEIERFHAAREWAQEHIRKLQQETAQRLGPVEAQIFEPQILMLEDTDLINGTVAYIQENHLSAARAFELRMLEFQSEWRRAGHPMIMDRINDLVDVQVLVLRRLLGLPAPELAFGGGEEKVILIARDLTPSITVQLDQASIAGVATDTGTRTSHSAILSRSLNIPAVVALGDLSQVVQNGQEVILDGRTGLVIVEPTDKDKAVYRQRDIKIREWEQELILLAHLEAITPDRQPVLVRANIDLPGEAPSAKAHGAQGIGLFRTEFLVVGRSAMPDEEEQYREYRSVAEAFPHEAVYIRTFDLGGDKFPLFLQMPPEENPFLGWRAIRVCLDSPDLFRPQLRALLRATAHGDVRIMLPMVNTVEEIKRTRALLDKVGDELDRQGIDYNSAYKLGIMIETPAAALNAHELARYADFFSIGTNDLVQYTLAVDRGNSRLAPRYTPFHPGVLSLLKSTIDAARSAGIEVSVCGEMASNPLGVFLFMGLGISALSVGPSALPEVKKIIRTVPSTSARHAVADALVAGTVERVTDALTRGISEWLDLSLFSGRWSLSPEE